MNTTTTPNSSCAERESSSTQQRVSVIIATLNESENIGRCLASIKRQNYPDIEVIVVDGESTDDTRLVAEQFGARLLLNRQRVQDVAKMLGLKAATGDVILLMDADNALVGNDYISRAVTALEVHQDAFAIESTYKQGPQMTSWNVYLTELLHISEPVSWLVSCPPSVWNCKGVERCTPTGAWPLGSNGFFFRRKDLVAAGILERDRFEDCAVALEVAERLKCERWLRIPGCGVQHYHTVGPHDFIAKRKRQAFHYLRYRDEVRHRWLAQKPRMSVLWACLCCVSVAAPVATALLKAIRTGRKEWLWHPLACLCNVLGLVLGVVAYARVLHEQALCGIPGPTDVFEASLQPHWLPDPASAPTTAQFTVASALHNHG